MPEDDVTRITGSHWPPPAQGSPNEGNRRLDRRGLVLGGVALVVTVAVLGAVAGIYLAGHRSAPKPQAAVTAATPVRLDSYARLACQKLDKAGKEWQGDKRSQLNASLDESDAAVDAAQSSVTQLATIAKQEDSSSTNYQAVTAALREWCSAHWGPGR